MYYNHDEIVTRHKKYPFLLPNALSLMSFFGFEERTLEREKNRRVEQDEDLAVYTWGEESYDGLGDALQEEHDELNDETFGDVGKVGE